MLRVRLAAGDGEGVARERLLELGAVEAADRVDARSLDDEGVVLVDQAPEHLLVAVAPSEGADADVTIAGSDDEQELVARIDDLWSQRLVPFEENLRTRRRATRRRTPILVGPDARWPLDAARLVDRLHAAVGDLALRIDHIGSTSVPGLRAKDLIDIQVTVRDLDDAAVAVESARRAGFVHVQGAWFGEDRHGVEHPEEVAVDADPGRPVNVNFRPVTAPVWRDALLFRDWLSAHAEERTSYEAMKARLAEDDGVHVDRYSEDKMPWIRAGLERAERWATSIGWVP
jgi:dephospho-CoA kinase